MRFHTEYTHWVESWNVLFCYPCIYLVVVGCLYKLQTSANRIYPSGVLFKAAIALYNALQVVICGYMFIGILSNWGWEGEWIFVRFFGWTQSFTPEIEWFVLVHFWSKILDFMDTVFILLKGNFRQLTFLHVYHHATIVLIWGWLLRDGYGNGPGAFGAAINSLVHMLMYFHYLIRTFGLRNPFKKMLTQVQILQFFACVTHAAGSWNFLSPHPCGVDKDKFCKWQATVQISYHIQMILLFGWFYSTSYKSAKVHPSPAAKKKLT